MLILPDDRRGFALVLALLALMILAGIASAALAAALGQLRAASRAGRVLAGQEGARAIVEAVIQETRGVPSASVGGPAVEMVRDTMGAYGIRRALDVRIAPEFHLFVGEAALGGGVPMRYARVVWWLDPESRVGAHRAVLEGGAVSMASGARVRSDMVLAERPGVSGCGLSPILGQTFGGMSPPVSGALPQPPEWGGVGDGSDIASLRLGRFSAPMLERLADRRLSEGGPPHPSCPGCWSGLVFGDGTVELLEEGAGVLVVDGDVTLGPGSSWVGLLLAAGDLTLTSGSRLVGLARAGGTISVVSGALVDGSACAALEALRNATSLARPLVIPGRSSAGPVSPAGG